MFSEVVKAFISRTDTGRFLTQNTHLGFCASINQLLIAKNLEPRVFVSPATIQAVQGKSLLVVTEHGDRNIDQVNRLAAAAHLQIPRLAVLVDAPTISVLGISPQPDHLLIHDVDYRSKPKEKIPFGRRLRQREDRISDFMFKLKTGHEPEPRPHRNRTTLRQTSSHLKENGAVVTFPDAGHSSHYWDNFDGLIKRAENLVFVFSEPGLQQFFQALLLPRSENHFSPQVRHPRCYVSEPISTDQLNQVVQDLRNLHPDQNDINPTNLLWGFYLLWTEAVRRNNYQPVSLKTIVPSQILAS